MHWRNKMVALHDVTDRATHEFAATAISGPWRMLIILSTCGLGGLGITSSAEHVAKAFSCKQASPKLKVCRHVPTRVGNGASILGSSSFSNWIRRYKRAQTLWGKNWRWRRLVFLQNCRSSSPWSFWHILAHFGTIAPHHPHPIKSVGLKFGKALPLPGKAGGLAAELAVGILELKDVSAQTWPCRRLWLW